MYKIDFRIWDENSEKMINVVDQETDREKMIFWFNKENTDLEQEEIMLNSFLRDCSGIYIYDGDIVEVHNEKESIDSYLSVVTVNLYTGTTISPHPKLKKLGIYYPIPLLEYVNDKNYISCNVVGNICTRPDLLDEIDKREAEIEEKDIKDMYIDIYYGKRKNYQDMLESNF